MDTKDITYFLNAEQEFCNAHPTYGKMSITLIPQHYSLTLFISA